MNRRMAVNGSPQTQAPKQNRWVCAAQTADKYSIAGALGTTNKTGFWANVFNGVAGNTVSGFVLAFSGNGNKWRLTTSVNNLTFQGTANAIDFATGPVPITELGLTETVGGDFLGATFGAPIALVCCILNILTNTWKRSIVRYAPSSRAQTGPFRVGA